jgi:DNA modification methylase
MNKLNFGDNLDVLRDHIDQESVDLVYLDPPFNSQENYNVLFKERSGAGVGAQIEAFRDTWKWEDGAANAYEDVMRFNGEEALVLKGTAVDQLAKLSPPVFSRPKMPRAHNPH